jgi:hypothetical protein
MEGSNMKPTSVVAAFLKSRTSRLVSTTAIAASLLVVPGAASPALAGHHHNGPAVYHQHHGYYAPRPVVAYGVAPRAYYAPIRVRYYRPAYAPGYYYLPSPYVVAHGPTLAANVIAYPTSAPVIYQEGYCPHSVHYHPYYPAPGVHGSFSIHVGF